MEKDLTSDLGNPTDKVMELVDAAATSEVHPERAYRLTAHNTARTSATHLRVTDPALFVDTEDNMTEGDAAGATANPFASFATDQPVLTKNWVKNNPFNRLNVTTLVFRYTDAAGARFTYDPVGDRFLDDSGEVAAVTPFVDYSQSKVWLLHYDGGVYTTEGHTVAEAAALTKSALATVVGISVTYQGTDPEVNGGAIPARDFTNPSANALVLDMGVQARPELRFDLSGDKVWKGGTWDPSVDGMSDLASSENTVFAQSYDANTQPHVKVGDTSSTTLHYTKGALDVTAEKKLSTYHFTERNVQELSKGYYWKNAELIATQGKSVVAPNAVIIRDREDTGTPGANGCLNDPVGNRCTVNWWDNVRILPNYDSAADGTDTIGLTYPANATRASIRYFDRVTQDWVTVKGQQGDLTGADGKLLVAKAGSSDPTWVDLGKYVDLEDVMGLEVTFTMANGGLFTGWDWTSYSKPWTARVQFSYTLRENTVSSEDGPGDPESVFAGTTNVGEGQSPKGQEIDKHATNYLETVAQAPYHKDATAEDTNVLMWDRGSAMLALDKVPNDPDNNRNARIGQLVPWTITVANAGNGYVDLKDIVDTLPATLQYVGKDEVVMDGEPGAHGKDVITFIPNVGKSPLDRALLQTAPKVTTEPLGTDPDVYEGATMTFTWPDYVDAKGNTKPRITVEESFQLKMYLKVVMGPNIHEPLVNKVQVNVDMDKDQGRFLTHNVSDARTGNGNDGNVGTVTDDQGNRTGGTHWDYVSVATGDNVYVRKGVVGSLDQGAATIAGKADACELFKPLGSSDEYWGSPCVANTRLNDAEDSFHDKWLLESVNVGPLDVGKLVLFDALPQGDDNFLVEDDDFGFDRQSTYRPRLTEPLSLDNLTFTDGRVADDSFVKIEVTTTPNACVAQGHWDTILSDSPEPCDGTANWKAVDEVPYQDVMGFRIIIDLPQDAPLNRGQGVAVRYETANYVEDGISPSLETTGLSADVDTTSTPSKDLAGNQFGLVYTPVGTNGVDQDPKKVAENAVWVTPQRGSLQVAKNVSGPADFAPKQITASVRCEVPRDPAYSGTDEGARTTTPLTFDGAESKQVTFTKKTQDGSVTYTSDVVDNIPVGATCTVTEDGDLGAFFESGRSQDKESVLITGKTGDEIPTITLTNTYSTSTLEFFKTTWGEKTDPAETDVQIPLPGAKFQLWRLDENGDPVALIDGQGAETQATFDYSNGIVAGPVLTTEQTGKVSATGLKPGAVYRLVEVVAPEGFTPIPDDQPRLIDDFIWDGVEFVGQKTAGRWDRYDDPKLVADGLWVVRIENYVLDLDRAGALSVMRKTLTGQDMAEPHEFCFQVVQDPAVYDNGTWAGGFGPDPRFTTNVPELIKDQDPELNGYVMSENSGKVCSRKIQGSGQTTQAAFMNFKLTLPGTYQFEITEIDTGIPGVTYDDEPVIVTFDYTITAQGDDVVTTYTKGGRAYDPVSGTEFTVGYTNDYAPTPTTGTPEVDKRLTLYNGIESVRDQDFTFRTKLTQVTPYVLPAIDDVNPEAPRTPVLDTKPADLDTAGAWVRTGTAPDDQPIDRDNGITATVNSKALVGADQPITFEDLTFTHPGEYVFEITEDQDSTDGRFVMDGKKVTWTVLVQDTPTTVQDPAHPDDPSKTITYKGGTLKVTSWSQTFDGDTVTGFDNGFIPDPVPDWPTVRKNVSLGGVAAEAPEQEFTFQMDPVTDYGDAIVLPKDLTATISTTDIRAGIDQVDFDPVVFNKAGTYEFEIVERVPNPVPHGWDYDPATVIWKVVVDGNAKGDGTFTTTSTYSVVDGEATTDPTWDNTYTVAPPVPEAPEVDKTLALNNGMTTVPAQTFTFRTTLDSFTPQGAQAPLTGEEARAVVLVGTEPVTEQGITASLKAADLVDGTAKPVAFGDLTFTKAGTYVLTVAEDELAVPGGFTTDKRPVTWTVVVKEKWDTAAAKPFSTLQLVVDSSTLTRDGKPVAADEAVFLNEFTPVAVDPVAEVTKVVTVTGAEAVADQDFTFSLTLSKGDASGVSMPADATAGVSASDVVAGKGAVAFGSVSFSKVGDYEFTIREVVPEELPAGWTYSTTPILWKVSVTDDGKGGLTETTSYTTEDGAEVADPTIVNDYRPGAITAVPQVRKDIVIRATAGGAVNDADFTFRLTPADEAAAAVMPDGATEIDRTYNWSRLQNDGTVVFDSLSFEKEGTYAFQIEELGDNPARGWRYDSTPVSWTVEVADNGKGELIAVGTYAKEGAESAEEARTFTNTYAASFLARTSAALKAFPLARTGAQVLGVAIAAGTLLVGGAWMTMRSRRRD